MSGVKKQAVTNIIWKFAERILAQAISFVVTIILARILSPQEFSTVSVVTIFFTIANVFISGGLNTALIQKKDADAEDYSSVLCVSTGISVVFYIILFMAAPWIAKIYRQEQLVQIIRVMAISLPVYAVKSIYCAYISANLQFRKFFWATLGGTIFSAIVGVWMAINGYGAWALIAQQVSNTLIDTIILVISTPMQILFRVSFSKLKKLFGYGWKIFLSSFLGTVYNETIPLVIGIKFTPASLSYYTKGRSFPSYLTTTTTATLSAVLFPILAKQQDDRETLLQYTRRFICVASYVVFPLMLGLFAVSDQFVLLVLTEKWMRASYYIKIFCVVFMFDMIHFGNCETIKAMGRSDIFLIMEIIKKASYFVVIVLFVVFGETPETLSWAFVVCTVIAIIVNSVPNRKLIGYLYKQQICDLLPNLAISAGMCIVVYLIGNIKMGVALCFVLQIGAGIGVYLLLSVITRNPNFKFLLNMIRRIKA